MDFRYESEYYKNQLLSIKLKIKDNYQYLNSLVTSFLTADINSLTQVETHFNNIRLDTSLHLNKLYRESSNEKIYNANKTMITTFYRLLKNAAEYLLAKLKESTNTKAYETYKKTMTNISECPFAVYIEQSFLTKMTTICQGQSLTRPDVNICSMTHDLQTTKKLFDMNREKTDQTYREYIRAWDNYRSVLLSIITKNYILLYNTELVVCLPRFLDQQTQLQIQFTQELNDWLVQHEAAPRLNLNVY